MPDNETDRWKNRRLMAWLSLLSGIFYPLIVLYSDSEQLGAIAPHFYLFVTGVVAVYTAGVVVDDHLQGKIKNDQS